jgi:hypothetical protein
MSNFSCDGCGLETNVPKESAINVGQKEKETGLIFYINTFGNARALCGPCNIEAQQLAKSLMRIVKTSNINLMHFIPRVERIGEENSTSNYTCVDCKLPAPPQLGTPLCGRCRELRLERSDIRNLLH